MKKIWWGLYYAPKSFSFIGSATYNWLGNADYIREDKTENEYSLIAFGFYLKI